MIINHVEVILMILLLSVFCESKIIVEDIAAPKQLPEAAAARGRAWESVFAFKIFSSLLLSLLFVLEAAHIMADKEMEQ